MTVADDTLADHGLAVVWLASRHDQMPVVMVARLVQLALVGGELPEAALQLLDQMMGELDQWGHDRSGWNGRR